MHLDLQIQQLKIVPAGTVGHTGDINLVFIGHNEDAVTPFVGHQGIE
jgi:hypothetical protein